MLLSVFLLSRSIVYSQDFPRTADQRVYHLGLRAGEVANRIVSYLSGAFIYIQHRPTLQITVGSASRAESIASFLDPEPKTFRLCSERGFITITGRYKTIPISIVSIGMGSPNVDFFIREVRECLSGDMIVIRWVNFFVGHIDTRNITTNCID